MLDKKIIDFDGLSRYHEKINEVFKTKQDVISDLDDIRSGAELGSTALQDIPDRSITFDKLDQDVLDELYGGLEIYSSVDELPDDAPQGSLASVAVNKIDEVKFSELYQPTSDEINDINDTGVVNNTNLSSVSSISINSSYDTSAEIQEFAVCLLSKVFDGNGGVGQEVIFGIALQEQQYIGRAMTLSLSTQEENQFELFTSNEDGTIIVNEENLSTINNFLSSTDFVYVGVLYFDGGEFLEPSYADMFYKAIDTIQKTELYIKDVNGWKKFSQVEIVDNLEDDSKDKALSANMGKVLNEMISNISFSSGADAVTFKGYVNVGGKTDIDKIFNMMKVGDACLCVPSITGGDISEDSYLPWILSGLNKNDDGYRIPLDESLLSVDKSQFTISNVANLIAGKGEVKTYFTLDADEPYAVCPDLLLLAKVKANLKDFMEATAGISDTILNLIPDGTEMTACVGKVLRWSGGDWLAQHMDDLNNLLYPEKPKNDNNLTHKYGYNYDMDQALETGIIGYTTVCSSGLPSGIRENFTVIVNGSIDADPNYRTITQFAYGRTGSATNRVWTRVLFKAVVSGYKDDFKPWVEISSEDLKSSISKIISEIDSSLSELYQYIGEVDNKISDIEDIRSGAALGATALQEVPAEYITESELDGKGYSTTTYVDEKVAALVNGAPDTLDTLDELAAALKDNKDIVTVLENSITSKQDKIEDLETIRSGAALGATALQEVPAEYVTETELNNKGYVNESTLTDYVKVDTFNNLSNTVNGKQDNISDLETIRSGAALGATALQEIPDGYVKESELAGMGYLKLDDLQFVEDSDIYALFA